MPKNIFTRWTGTIRGQRAVISVTNCLCSQLTKKYFNGFEGNKILVDTLLKELDAYYNPETGTWYKGNPPDHIKINGAIKVFSGLQWLDYPYPDTHVLLDFALKQPFEPDGCNFLNRLFVVHQAKRGLEKDYRVQEIKKLARKALKKIMEFHQTDGGFSFFKNRAQTNYYHARVSKGLPVSDLHGTTMFVWTIALCLELLGDDGPEGSEAWRVHRA